jgi:hypothetical protein
MPSALERFDSKYMTRVMQSVGDRNAPNGLIPQPASSDAAKIVARMEAARTTATPERRTHQEAKPPGEDAVGAVKIGL